MIPAPLVRGSVTVAAGYQPFPDIAARNGLQATIEVPLMLHALGVPLGGRILEVGCGRGVALPVLMRICRPRLLIGLDINAAAVAIAADRLGDSSVPARVVRGDVHELPFADASFDVVIDFGTCYHVERPADALREVARVLRPGGLFVHETRISQRLAHPVRSFGRRLPWAKVPELRRHAGAVLWAARMRTVASHDEPIRAWSSMALGR